MVVLVRVCEDSVRQESQTDKFGGVECKGASSATSSGWQQRREWSAQSSGADMVWVGMDQKSNWYRWLDTMRGEEALRQEMYLGNRIR